MASLQISFIILVFLSIARFMFLRKLPAIFALPILAFFIPVISGVSVNDTIQLVLVAGSTRFSEAYTIAIFGSMLSILLQKTGVAESFIKMGAELSCDNPFFISLIMLTFIMLLFTTLGGLGAIIMVATVVLPILSAAGLSAVTASGVFLLGLSIGGILNVGNWAVYTNVLNLAVDEVRAFALSLFFLTYIFAIIYITIQLYRDGNDINFKKIGIFTVIFVLTGASFYFVYNALPQNAKDSISFIFSLLGNWLKFVIGAFIVFLFVFSLVRIIKKQYSLFWGAYFIPLIPLFLILLFNVNFIASFIVGLIYGFVSTFRKNSLNILLRSILEGGGVVMPAVALMLGIGMLLNAVMGPAGTLPPQYSSGWPVLTLLKPVMIQIIPHTFISYVLLFTLAAPLALYRGPLNVWGMGYGLAAIFLSGGLQPGAIMGVLLSVGQIQGISDPTNTQNVWLANEMRIDVQKILWNTIPYTWLIALFGLILAGIRYF